MKKKKCLLIDRLLQDNWFTTMNEAVPWIMAGKILVNNQPATGLKVKIDTDAEIRIREYYKTRYVNKGGLKLEGALRDFQIDVTGKTALDCGASTGGFTDCLIQFGAKKVYAVDVGYGQLAGKLQINPDVVNMEKMNLSDPVLLKLEPIPDIITLDLSYLSLTKAVPICKEILHGKEAQLVCLVKPLFEIADSEMKRSGNVLQISLIRDMLRTLCLELSDSNTSIFGITNSPVSGNRGTLEFFLGISVNARCRNIDIDSSIDIALERAKEINKFNKNSYTNELSGL